MDAATATRHHPTQATRPALSLVARPAAPRPTPATVLAACLVLAGLAGFALTTYLLERDL